jgi:hypothetical protein
VDTRHPAIWAVMQAIRRTHGTAQREAIPLRNSTLRPILVAFGTTGLIDRRDRTNC